MIASHMSVWTSQWRFYRERRTLSFLGGGQQSRPLVLYCTQLRGCQCPTRAANVNTSQSLQHFLLFFWPPLEMDLKCVQIEAYFEFAMCKHHLVPAPKKCHVFSSNFRITDSAMSHNLFVGWRWQDQPTSLPGGAKVDKMLSRTKKQEWKWLH